MANPLFPVSAAIRLSDVAMYAAIAALYQFGTPLISGVAPQTLATTYGLTLYSAVTDPGLPASVPGVVVVSFPNPVPSVVVGGTAYPVEVNAGGGTIVGANYTDPNGVFYPNVDWRWAISAEFYTNSASGTLGTWDQQIVTYTGDGTVARLIPTTFPLDVGVVAIWIFPHSVDTPAFRNTTMPGTTMTASPIVTLGGIMSFAATGFTVTDRPANGCWVNRLATQYTALVLRDTTIDNRYLRAGTYVGDGVNGRQIDMFGAPIAAPTQVWVFGRSGQAVFSSDQLPANTSVSFGVETKSLTLQIQALKSQCFNVGSDNNVNNAGGGLTYYWTAFFIPVGDVIRNLFRTYKATGTGSVLPVTGFGFTPGFATARQYTAGLPVSVWRDPWNTLLTSNGFDQVGLASGGIRALDSDGITLGTVVASAGMDVYGFALATSGSVTVPVPPVWNPTPNPPTVPPGTPPPGGPVPPGFPPGSPSPGPTGCSATVAAS